jgi:hypothetical protein
MWAFALIAKPTCRLTWLMRLNTARLESEYRDIRSCVKVSRRVCSVIGWRKTVELLHRIPV